MKKIKNHMIVSRGKGRSAKVTVKLDLDDEDWYDLWHVHLDIFGNAEDISHRDLIVQGITLYRQIREQATNFKKPWQSWIVIELNSLNDSAVYFHTPNPNKDNLPYSFEDVQWAAETPSILDGLIDHEEFVFGRSENHGETLLWIKQK
jgi:hypothetical protein